MLPVELARRAPRLRGAGSIRLVKLVPDMYSVRELVTLVDDGQLAIPEFQRRFVWRPPAVADLLVSVARRWPIGSLLLLEGPQDFAVRKLEGAPELTSAELLVLDGQQRITALYLALGDRSTDEIYVIDFRALREDRDLGDEHILARRRRTFERQFPDIERRARAGLLTVHEASDNSRFAEWQRYLPTAEQTGAFALRDELLGGLQAYTVPAVRLNRDIDMGALAKIFESINRTGERLKPLDLMVARLYPHDFRLADEWKAVEREFPAFKRYAVDGLELLRLVALRAHVEARRDGRPDGPRGIRGGDVLKLDPELVKQHWKWSIDAYVDVLAFVEERCGVRGSELLPSSTMLLPLALVLSQQHPGAAEAARRFFWAATLTQAYAQGANTQALKDARELVAEVLDDGEPPETVRAFAPDEALLQDVRRRNESALRGLLCLLVIDGALDWADGEPLATRETVQAHQIFPARWLSTRGVSADALLNFTPLSLPLPDELKDRLPHELLKSVDADVLASHGIALESERLADWTRFAEVRFRFWLKRLRTLTDELHARAPAARAES
jgi:hypothetical protein